MFTSRFSTVFACALALGSFASAASAQVTIEADQPAYEVTQLLTVKISAPPGSPTFVLVDVWPGPVATPLGLIHIGFSPVFFVVGLGNMPASGSMSVHEAFTCRTTFTYGTEVYLQAVAVVGGAKVLSNGLHLAEMKGDCSDVCTQSITELGLQVDLENVPASGSLFINAWKGGDPSGQTYGPPIDIMFDLADVAVGMIDPPITNASGSIAVSMLELNGTTLTIRFFVDATLAGQTSLEDTTYFAISYDSSKTLAGTKTDCSVPLKVGDSFGKFTVIKLIDGG